MVGLDRRIGQGFLKAGIGFGGSCLPKDLDALYYLACKNGYKPKLLDAIARINNGQIGKIVNKIAVNIKGLKNKHIAILGVTFKPQTDDMREAPSLVIIEKLHAAGCQIKAYDPQAFNEAKRLVGNKIELVKEPYEALIDAEALVIATEWQEFRYPNFKVMAKLMKNKLIFDGRNIFDYKEMREQGFKYFCIGISTDSN